MFQRQDSAIKDDYDDGSAIKNVAMIMADKEPHLSPRVTNEMCCCMNIYNFCILPRLIGALNAFLTDVLVVL